MISVLWQQVFVTYSQEVDIIFLKHKDGFLIEI